MARLSVISPWLGILGLIVSGSVPGTAAEPLQYNRDVRPILADKCFQCHGPDSASRQADLRLDRREAAIEAGAIEPGEPDNSELIARIGSDDPDLLMPPPAIHKTLTATGKGSAAALDHGRCRVPAALVVHTAAAPHAAAGSTCELGPELRSTTSSWPAWKQWGSNRPRRPIGRHWSAG